MSHSYLLREINASSFLLTFSHFLLKTVSGFTTKYRY